MSVSAGQPMSCRLALVAIAVELQAIRLHLDGDTPAAVVTQSPIRAVVLDDVSDRIVIG